MADLKLGDVVRLRSGGTAMTVIELGSERLGPSHARVAWHVDASMQGADVPLCGLVAEDLRPGELVDVFTGSLTGKLASSVDRGVVLSTLDDWRTPPAEPRDVSDSLSYLRKLVLERRKDVRKVVVSSAPYRMFCATAYDEHGPTEARVGNTELAALMVLATELGVFGERREVDRLDDTYDTTMPLADRQEASRIVRLILTAHPAITLVTFERCDPQDDEVWRAYSQSSDFNLHRIEHGQTYLVALRRLAGLLKVDLTVVEPKPEPTGPARTLDELAEVLQDVGVVHLGLLDGKVVVGLPAFNSSNRYTDLATAFEQTAEYVRTTRRAQANSVNVPFDERAGGGPVLE